MTEPQTQRDWSKVARELSALFELPELHLHATDESGFEFRGKRKRVKRKQSKTLVQIANGRGFYVRHVEVIRAAPGRRVVIGYCMFRGAINPDKCFWLLLHVRALGFDVSALETDFTAQFTCHEILEWRMTFLERLTVCGIDRAPFVEEL